jgi:isoquinoline 1-oxidoreductase subunit beta
VEGSREIPYEIANFRCDFHTPSVGVPTLWWRSVEHTHTGYAVECFILSRSTPWGRTQSPAAWR